jgi:hypothetical protein
MSQKTVRRVSSSPSEFFTLRLNESWVRAKLVISNMIWQKFELFFFLFF